MKSHGLKGWMMAGLGAVVLLAITGCHHRTAPSAEARRQTRLDWNLKTLVEAYEKNPDSSLNGEDSARAALTEFARIRAKAFTADEPWMQIMQTNVEAALKAGCDDPQVRYLYLRFSADGQAMDAVTRATEMMKIAQKMQGSRYPMIRKFYLNFHAFYDLYAAYGYERTNMPPDILAYVDSVSVLPDLTSALNDDTIPVGEAYDACHDFLDANASSKDYYQNAYQSFETLFFTRWPDDSLSWLLKGEANYRMAWQSRGGGYANEVSEDGWKGFHDHLALSGQALTTAWKIDPHDVLIANLMIKQAEAAEMKREDMEVWFSRAMELDPDNYDACSAKLHYLYPQWYGSRADMLAFGRECVANEKWGGRVPLILSDAHWEYWRYTQTDDDRTKYWKQPDVWPDIEASFDRFFQVNPDVAGLHQNYAWFAYQCGQWAEFNRQLGQFGSSTNYDYFGGQEIFDQMVQTAKAQAGSP